MKTELLSPLALAYTTWHFFHCESERIRHLREYSLSSGVGELFQSLAGQHALALRRTQQARVDWLKAKDAETA